MKKQKNLNICPDKTYNRAVLLKHLKHYIDGDYIVEIKVWKVRKDKHHKEGIKYSYALIKNGTRILCYDNREGKGHHVHLFGIEKKFTFKSLSALESEFKNKIKKLIKNDKSKKHRS